MRTILVLQVGQTCDLYDSLMIFWGDGKKDFLRVRPAGVGFGRLVLLKIHLFLFQSFWGVRIRMIRAICILKWFDTCGKKHGSEKRWHSAQLPGLSGWNYSSNWEEFKMKPVSFGGWFLPWKLLVAWDLQITCRPKDNSASSRLSLDFFPIHVDVREVLGQTYV